MSGPAGELAPGGGARSAADRVGSRVGIRIGIRIGIDTGGTFTDVVAVISGRDRDTVVLTTKTPSTPADPADGFLTGIDRILQIAVDGGYLGPDGTAADAVAAVEAVLHGTTVATNQLLQGAVADLGLITNEGYESILEIARQSVPDGYGNSYFWVKPDRIVPADRVAGVAGRLDHRGAEIRSFDLEGARAAARRAREWGLRSVGVCFLHSYAGDKHERMMAAVLAQECPELIVSLSCDVLPEYREYERAMTTLVDAAVKPTVAAYVENIARRLGELRAEPPIRFSIMRSSGGVLSADAVVRQPISTVLSGPAAGALGAATIAAAAGHRSVLTCDGGGTSTDVCVIADARPTLTTEGSVGPYPTRIPMIDVVTVGAGGGSVAWVSPEGTLKVGPRSAGADPGPLCYGRGGTEPTVTDAQLVLGRIPPHLLGGEIALDVAAAQAGIAELGERIGLDPQACAEGICEISAWNQANALRRVTVQRGLDVRDFPLVTFGGSGSLLACRLMDILGLPMTLVPPNPGNVSAFGLLTVDVRNDGVRTMVFRDVDLDAAPVGQAFDELTGQAVDLLTEQGFDAAAHVLQRAVDLRYLGQAYEVRVDAPGGPVDRSWADAVVAAFHDAHRRLYGYDFRDRPEQLVEWVNLRVTGIGPIPRPRLPEVPDRPAAPTRARRAHFGGWTDATIVQRVDLGRGAVVTGPAVVEEFGSTVPVFPGFCATVDRWGNLVLTREDS